MKDNKELIRKIKFTLFSISAGIIEIGLFTLLTEFTSMGYWACYLIALVASVIWNFTLNREYTFKSTVNVPIAMTKVFIFYLIFTPVSTILGNYLVNTFLWNEYLVTGLNMLANFILEYLYDKYIVFKGTIDTKEKKNKKEVSRKKKNDEQNKRVIKRQR
jgi:putative flippase GtrA